MNATSIMRRPFYFSVSVYRPDGTLAFTEICVGRKEKRRLLKEINRTRYYVGREWRAFSRKVKRNS